MEQSTAARLMRTPNYGRAIASYSARYSARYYRVIIAVLVVTSLIVETMHTNIFLQALTAGGILLYITYTVVRLLLPDRWISRYYTPRIQFWRAQINILSLTLLLTGYAISRQPTILWVLYLLAVMIVSEHCRTSIILFTLAEIGLLLIWLGHLGSDLSLIAYLRFSSAFVEASRHALAILLLGFLLHYLVRNVEARDTTIARYRDMLDTLADNIRSLHDPQAARRLVLSICRKTRNADCASLWVLDSRANELRLAACTLEEGKHPDCPVCISADDTFSIPLGDDRLPSCVARTNRQHFASRADDPPQHLSDALSAPRPFLPYARLELGVPIPDFQPHQPASFAVLCLAFERPMKHEEMRQEYDAICELARYLSPTLYYASLLEQYQALQHMAQAITRSLDRDRVLDTLLELVTSVFGFDFATISLVDQVREVIYTVCGKNVSQEWIAMAIHPLSSDDIQADIIRTGRVEILSGWDKRFDREIWEQFGHEDMTRVFMPMTVLDPLTGQEERIGTLEAGYRRRTSRELVGEENQKQIGREQVELLRPFVNQAAVAVAKAHLYERMQSEAEALTALHHGGRAIQSAVWQPERLLEQIGQSAEKVLKADLVFLFGYDGKRREVDSLFIGGDVWGKGKPVPRLGEGNILDTIIQERRPFYFPDAQNEPRLVGYGGADGHRRRTFTQRQKVASFAGVPLLSGEELLGIMCVNYRSPHRFSKDEQHIIELFAQQAAIALQSAQQRRQEHELTISQERTAFSRELHHSTSQALFATELKARTALHHLGSDDDRAACELKNILDIANDAKQHLGYLLSEFNTRGLDDRDFRDVLQETVDRIRRHYDVQVHCDGRGEVDLSTQVHFRLSRIVKEALNNAVRHADCRSILVSYALRPHEVTLEIVDDGVGFNPERVLRKKDRYGLNNMQRYARDLGCGLGLQSAPGQGTRVAVRFSLPVP